VVPAPPWPGSGPPAARTVPGSGHGGQPRLRIPGDPRNPTVASRQRGAPQFGVGCFWVIRNPATHETSEWPPQEALEQLAALSLLA